MRYRTVFHHARIQPLPNQSKHNAPLPSPGSKAVQVPRLPRYYQGAMTSCRLSRRTSFPSHGRYHSERSCFARTRPSAAASESLGVGHPVSPAGIWSVETAGSPTFLGNPDCALALPFDPGGTDASGLGNASARPPVCPRRRLPHSYYRGSITRLRHWLSTLRRPDYSDATQDSLPAVGQTLPDGLDYPQGSIERFHDVSYIHPPFPSST
jgi:hypothetical protein